MRANVTGFLFPGRLEFRIEAGSAPRFRTFGGLWRVTLAGIACATRLVGCKT